MLQKANRVSAFRLSPPTSPNIPLRVRSVGRSDVHRGWCEPPVQKWFTELTWCISGDGEALVGGNYLPLRAGEILIYRPGDTHHIRALSSRWAYCWITFDHPESAKWIEGFGLGTRKMAVEPCPENLFLGVLAALRAMTPDGEKHAAAQAHAILLAAATSKGAPVENTLSIAAKRLLDECFMDPEFNITNIASELGVHRSTLFRHFTSAYHLKPSTYLLNIRLHRGMDLLQNTNRPVQEVALEAGFTDANYFSRAIREATGRTPRSFRSVGKARLK